MDDQRLNNVPHLRTIAAAMLFRIHTPVCILTGINDLLSTLRSRVQAADCPPTLSKIKIRYMLQ